MRELRSEIGINAPPERVWEVLTDFESLPAWNPFWQRAAGELRAGERLVVHMKLPGGSGMTFKPKLVSRP